MKVREFSFQRRSHRLSQGADAAVRETVFRLAQGRGLFQDENLCLQRRNDIFPSRAFNEGRRTYSGWPDARDCLAYADQLSKPHDDKRG